MLRLLAIDTTADVCSLALLGPDTDLSIHEELPRQHARQLLPRLDALFADAGWAKRSLDAVVYGRGPGSFTGIRIAAGVAQGIALGADCPILPISTLETLAFEDSQVDQETWVALDARMQELYFARYQIGADGLPALIDTEQLMDPSGLPEPLSGVRLVGNGWLTDYGFSENWRAHLTTQPIALTLPKASVAARLAQRRLVENPDLALPPESALPIYLRDKVTWDNKPKVGS
ncbi:tRNA (adenosine(37)-N6)-threonylcarbamoyltransferase complex dimerization subunit type 1 TsaB [Saccharospirillum sp. MSK14-1]|uniref:tRNA (adenosine(37)-N6)-threonylcarbamoyltransferase complex dimerization subunit type 1 TsaB n=1 Tax=Saccharospirillum sp. MSK14-1 TaxID=1897632 RepID=UPI000D39A84B|nr:tRNA (adenosine(37)-N6)-threonylcarbamoyltransferase complex dimerization subunit type 1 TsaB [Saccharospirillum sp. MSK14-1]PTY36919.1 tRNA (adenosine(37)-N6)-threonylcarbamoyltransferase complex dimerization subunit type 1 TsaB [Saccharospirillum sp. MSK14-1]